MAVFTSTVYGDYFPTSDYKTYVWIASLGIAASCAVLRVTSGSHFPTDVIVGAVVGSSVGYLIPYIHRTRSANLSLAPIVSPRGSGISLTVRF